MRLSFCASTFISSACFCIWLSVCAFCVLLLHARLCLPVLHACACVYPFVSIFVSSTCLCMRLSFWACAFISVLHAYPCDSSLVHVCISSEYLYMQLSVCACAFFHLCMWLSVSYNVFSLFQSFWVLVRTERTCFCFRFLHVVFSCAFVLVFSFFFLFSRCIRLNTCRLKSQLFCFHSFSSFSSSPSSYRCRRGHIVIINVVIAVLIVVIIITVLVVILNVLVSSVFADCWFYRSSAFNRFRISALLWIA